jgi:DNA-binding CsgD family transcriptional regulator
VTDNYSTKAPRNESHVLAALATELVSAIGHDDFFAVLARRLSAFFPYDWLVVFLYRCGATPVLLHDTISSENSREGISNYLRNTYLLSPIYRAFLGGLQPGLYLMRDLVHREPLEDSDVSQFGVRIDRNEEVGFLTQGWPKGMQELLLAFPVPEGGLIEVSLSRSAARGGVDGVSPEPLRRIFRLLLSCIRKHWEIRLGDCALQPEQYRLVKQVQSFDSAPLTLREREIVKMILRGHSSASIARELYIALPTVKTHRRNAYEKLGVNTMAELVARFLQPVREPQN